jgi:hypothetical protein
MNPRDLQTPKTPGAHYSNTKAMTNTFKSGQWMELENIILSEVSQARKDKNHMFSLIGGL